MFSIFYSLSVKKKTNKIKHRKQDDHGPDHSTEQRCLMIFVTSTCNILKNNYEKFSNIIIIS